MKKEPEASAPEATVPDPTSFGYGDTALKNPCAGCDAQCCRTLVFPHGLPATASNLDYLRFSLGFPGVELGVSDETWTIALRTTCRHLREDQCSIYGQPERPLICSYYDEWSCTYRWEYGQARPDGFLRVRLEDFEALARAFRFDESGAVVEAPSVEALAAQLDGRGL